MPFFRKRGQGEKPALPWADKKPIFSALREWDGDPSFELPDEPEAGQNEIRFASGALDGIFSHHLGSSEQQSQDRLLESTMFALYRLVAADSDYTRAALYNIFLGESAFSIADSLMEKLKSQRKLSRTDIVPHARWLVHCSAHREPLKVGVILLGLSGTEDDIPDLLMLARHDEFSLYAAVAASNIADDPIEIWWEMARNVHGWGKVHIVERLARHALGRTDLQYWLLRDGCENAVMDEYLALVCARGGDMAGALADDIADSELIDGACRIFEALFTGGPAEDIDSYAEGVFVIKHLMCHLMKVCTSITRLHFVWSLRSWLEWPSPGENVAQHPTAAAGNDGPDRVEGQWERRKNLGWTETVRADLAQACDLIIKRPEWRERVRVSYLSGDQAAQYVAWSLADAVGIDLWEDAFEQLTKEPLNSTLYFRLMKSIEFSRVRRILEFAEQHLPLASIASGPSEDHGLGPGYEAHTCLDYVLQEMPREGVFSDALVAAGMRSPVIRNRSMATAALEAHPISDWGEKTRDALNRTLSDECNEKLRERFQRLIDKLWGDGPANLEVV